mmetsp:Transcript_21760/g.39987  ORF Transcript_21760/g.39987 Transcript_21760/m.39987 type:complete len:134 (-) Transcript_21760:35-436(-)
MHGHARSNRRNRRKSRGDTCVGPFPRTAEMPQPDGRQDAAESSESESVFDGGRSSEGAAEEAEEEEGEGGSKKYLSNLLSCSILFCSVLMGEGLEQWSAYCLQLYAVLCCINSLHNIISKSERNRKRTKRRKL